MLRETMTATGGNQSEAARRLGLSRMGLIKKLARLGLRESVKGGHEDEASLLLSRRRGISAPLLRR